MAVGRIVNNMRHASSVYSSGEIMMTLQTQSHSTKYRFQVKALGGGTRGHTSTVVSLGADTKSTTLSVVALYGVSALGPAVLVAHCVRGDHLELQKITTTSGPSLEGGGGGGSEDGC